MNLKQQEQWKYLQDEARLVQFIESSGFCAIGGERQRSYSEQQRKFDAGLSKAKPGQSQHQKCKASDFELFDESGAWLKVPDQADALGIDIHKTKVIIFGDYWESLDPKNFWGGNIPGLYDPGHFERRD